MEKKADRKTNVELLKDRAASIAFDGIQMYAALMARGAKDKYNREFERSIMTTNYMNRVNSLLRRKTSTPVEPMDMRKRNGFLFGRHGILTFFHTNDNMLELLQCDSRIETRMASPKGGYTFQYLRKAVEVKRRLENGELYFWDGTMVLERFRDENSPEVWMRNPSANKKMMWGFE
jgi:hypothetical protein